jgi:hypothetical protein
VYSRTTRAQKREKIDELLRANYERSNRAIALEVHSDHKTVGRLRADLETAGVIPARIPRPQAHGGALLPSEPGNQRATKSGVKSEMVVAPIRARHLDTLRERFPDEPEPVLWIAASRAARIEVLSGYLDRVGLIQRRGVLNGAATELTKLETALEKQLAVLAERAKERQSPGNGLAAVLAEIAESGNGDGNDGNDGNEEATT